MVLGRVERSVRSRDLEVLISQLGERHRTIYGTVWMSR